MTYIGRIISKIDSISKVILIDLSLNFYYLYRVFGLFGLKDSIIYKFVKIPLQKEETNLIRAVVGRPV